MFATVRMASANVMTSDAAAVAAKVEETQRLRKAADEARPLTDITLRAEADGATARVHRGVLACHSRVLKEALESTPETDVLPLPGKSGVELDTLTAWMYRECEVPFTTVRNHVRLATWLWPSSAGPLSFRLWLPLIRFRCLSHLQGNVASMLAMAREYDMPRLSRDAESWLVLAASQGKLFFLLRSECAANACEFMQMLSLAREFKLRRFAASCDVAVDALTTHQAQQLLKMETAAALTE